MEPGTIVGASRWPYQSAHPECWGKPWKGVLLDVADPRAWDGSIAFGGGKPTKAAVLTHLLQIGWPTHRVPVLWEFGRVYWERADAVRLYSDDVIAWHTAKKIEMAAARRAINAERRQACNAL